MKTWLFLVRREWRLFGANKVFVVAFLVMPLLFATVFGFVYCKGKVTDLPVIVIDKDRSPSAFRFRDMLEEHQSLTIRTIRPETEDLHQLLLDTRSVAIIVIPYRFEANLLAGRRPEVTCYLNMANTLTANAAGSAVSVCAATMNIGILTTTWQKKGLPAALAAQQHEAFKSNLFYRYNPGNNYLYFLWPGFIFSTLHQLLLLALAVSFSREMQAGTFSRRGLLQYSRSPFSLILVKMTPYLLLSGWTIGGYWALGYLFRLPAPAHPGLLLLSQGLLVAGASLLGILFSIIIPLPLKASQLLMSVASPAFTLSGFTWPSEQAPVVLAAFGKIVPLTPYLKTLRMVLLQQAGWTDVGPTVTHQLVLIAVYLSGSVILLYLKIRKATRTSP